MLPVGEPADNRTMQRVATIGQSLARADPHVFYRPALQRKYDVGQQRPRVGAGNRRIEEVGFPKNLTDWIRKVVLTAGDASRKEVAPGRGEFFDAMFNLYSQSFIGVREQCDLLPGFCGRNWRLLRTCNR